MHMGLGAWDMGTGREGHGHVQGEGRERRGRGSLVVASSLLPHSLGASKQAAPPNQSHKPLKTGGSRMMAAGPLPPLPPSFPPLLHMNQAHSLHTHTHSGTTTENQQASERGGFIDSSTLTACCPGPARPSCFWVQDKKKREENNEAGGRGGQKEGRNEGGAGWPTSGTLQRTVAKAAC